MKMKITRILLSAVIGLTAFLPVKAQEENAVDCNVSSGTLTRNGEFMTVDINFDFNDIKVGRNEALVLSPMIVNGEDTVWLRPVSVYGGTAWIQHRRGILKAGEPETEMAVKYSSKLQELAYQENVPYVPVMEGSELLVRKEMYGCAGCKAAVADSPALAWYEGESPFSPVLIYQAAVDAGVKTRELAGRAYVDFPVNKIVIYPDYRNNTYELGKIIATIDSVKNDPDITVTSIHIAGTASPEGPYDNNVYLAKNRTIALKEYVTNLYNFPKDFIQTSYEPVDWKGLREWLESNNLQDKDKILAIVNSDIEPYARNLKIKTDFPKEYQWLLLNVYPALRHSDYVIRYQIREFTDVAEISELIRTQPQKLSLNEMYRLASSLEPGTQEYNEVFETAVRMYPEDEVANLNAANNALARGDLIYAERYLEKAGNSPEAIYARGMLKGMQGDYSEGLKLLQQAREAGLQGTDTMIEYFTKHSR